MKERFTVTNDRAFKQSVEPIDATMTIKKAEKSGGHFAVSRTGNIEFETGGDVDVNKAVKFIQAFDKGFLKTRAEIIKRREICTGKLMETVNKYCSEMGLKEATFAFKADETEFLDMSIDLLDDGYEIIVTSNLVFMVADNKDIDALVRFKVYDVLKSLVDFGKTDHRRFDRIANPSLAEFLDGLYKSLEKSYLELGDEKISEIIKNNDDALDNIRSKMTELGNVHVVRC